MPAVLLIIFSLIQFFSWTFFAKVIGNSPTAIEVATFGFVEPFLGILTGAPWIVLLVFVRAWGFPFIIHSIAIIALALRWEYVAKNKDVLFLSLVLVLCILLYYVQFYFLSFQVEWWITVAKSLDRSSAFLIPISGYLLVRMVVSSLVLKEKT